QKDTIVNLMSSIAFHLGKTHTYQPLDIRCKHKKIMLIVIDGLGYHHIPKDTFIYQHIKQKLTSTILSTTSVANTVFLTGYPAQQHGLVGWRMYSKEFGCIISPLPFNPTFSKHPLDADGYHIKDIMHIPGFYAKGTYIASKKFIHSHFNAYVNKGMRRIALDSYKQIAEVLPQKATRFTHMYMYEVDQQAHKTGITSKEVLDIIYTIDTLIQDIVRQVKDTTIIITADHGFLTVQPHKELWIQDFEQLHECLSMPLTGESGFRFCFVKAHKQQQFIQEAQKYAKFWWCYPSYELLNNNIFGIGTPHTQLRNRIGDYCLIMKDGYILKDKTFGYKVMKHIGVHGGVSKEEMEVPLIVIE
ncbi:MAG: alkaline phosphatase family protein, partial [Candidatus Woesearchaeota archaeon]